MLVDLILPAVLTIIMFSLGLGLTGADFARVLRTPRACGRALEKMRLARDFSLPKQIPNQRKRVRSNISVLGRLY